MSDAQEDSSPTLIELPPAIKDQIARNAVAIRLSGIPFDSTERLTRLVREVFAAVGPRAPTILFTGDYEVHLRLGIYADALPSERDVSIERWRELKQLREPLERYKLRAPYRTDQPADVAKLICDLHEVTTNYDKIVHDVAVYNATVRTLSTTVDERDLRAYEANPTKTGMVRLLDGPGGMRRTFQDVAHALSHAETLLTIAGSRARLSFEHIPHDASRRMCKLCRYDPFHETDLGEYRYSRTELEIEYGKEGVIRIGITLDSPARCL